VPVATDRVPFLDLGLAHQELKGELLRDLDALIDSGAFTLGPAVGAFEQAFAEYCGAEHCVGLASGLDALRLGLLAAGIRPGDEVVVPAATFAATFEAVTQAGARPVVVDVGEADYGIDPEAVAAAVGPRTRAVVPVHLYGQLVDARRLAEVATRAGLVVLEDACQAHGAERDGIVPGATSAGAAFSFYPGKNLGAFGDAGALVTGDGDLAARLRALREHGQTEKYRHRYDGYTSRLDTIQALVLLRKLPLLDEWNASRRRAADAYARLLDGVGDLRLPATAPGSSHVWHLYVVRTAEPERLGAFLAERGVATGRHYPEPPHRAEAFAGLGYGPGTFPVAEALSRECLSLPIFPGITDEQLERVAAAIAEFF
jgi:dTDP-4-amino-4,6-dideoxygalactose transaminase